MNNISYDNVEDRKEIFNMISNYLNERERLSFLEYCCNLVNTSVNNCIRPGKNSSLHEKEVYWQLMSLAFMHGLNLDAALIELQRRVRLK